MSDADEQHLFLLGLAREKPVAAELHRARDAGGGVSLRKLTGLQLRL